MDDAYARLTQVVDWFAWLACALAVGRLIWLGGLFSQAKRGHGEVGPEQIGAILVGVIMVGVSATIAIALLS